jgi:DNA-binding HxlR family transcriptional regulator
MRAMRQLPIVDVARALDLRFGTGGMIHCWRPGGHQHGDRTASVGVQRSLNRVKCFGCDSRLMGPLDLVADVLGIEIKEAALWIAARFKVPCIAPGKHLEEPPRIIHRVGFETPLGLLIRSGLWARLSPITQRLAPVLLEFSEFKPADREKHLCLSYRAMMRYTAVVSPNALGKALGELEEIGWLEREKDVPNGPARKVAEYRLTPFSDAVQESAQMTAGELKADVSAEKELRKQEKRKRIDAIPTIALNGTRKKTAA